MRWSHTTLFGCGAYGIQAAGSVTRSGIKVPGGSGGVGADEKSLQPAVYIYGKKCFGLFMDGVAVVLLCNVMRAVRQSSSWRVRMTLELGAWT